MREISDDRMSLLDRARRRPLALRQFEGSVSDLAIRRRARLELLKTEAEDFPGEMARLNREALTHAATR